MDEDDSDGDFRQAKVECRTPDATSAAPSAVAAATSAAPSCSATSAAQSAAVASAPLSHPVYVASDDDDDDNAADFMDKDVSEDDHKPATLQCHTPENNNNNNNRTLLTASGGQNLCSEVVLPRGSRRYSVGPLQCCLPGCDFTLKYSHLYLHWKDVHQQFRGGPSLADTVFLEVRTGQRRRFFNFFPHVIVCRVCHIIRH